MKQDTREILRLVGFIIFWFSIMLFKYLGIENIAQEWYYMLLQWFFIMLGAYMTFGDLNQIDWLKARW